MRFVLIVLLLIVLVALIFITARMIKINWANRLTSNLQKIFQKLEAEYENYIDQKLSAQILENKLSELDLQNYLSELRVILQPYVDALWAIVNANYISEPLALDFEIKYFNNLFFITEKFLRQKLPLTSSEKQELEQALLDAIKADLAKRNLQLKTGDLALEN